MAFEEVLAAFRRGENGAAARLSRRDLAAARERGDVAASVDALCMLARVALREGNLDEVASYAEEAEDLARRSAVERLVRMPLHMRAVAARMSGRYDEGRQLYLRSIALNDALGEAAMAAAEHRNLAYLEIRAGRANRARELFTESVARFAKVDAPAMTPYLTFDQATIAALDGNYELATELLTTAQNQWDEHGTIPDPDDAAEIDDLRRRLSGVL